MRILLADANLEVLAALRLLLEQPGGHRIVAEVQEVVGLLYQVTCCCPELLILDPDLPGIQPRKQANLTALAALVETLHRLCPGMRLVLLSSRPELERPCRELKIDAKIDAFICKNDPPEGLVLLLNLLGYRGIQANP